MRLLHVDTGREMRGGQRQVLLLLNGLREAGHECVLLAHTGSPLFESAAEASHAVYPATLANLWLRSKQADLVHSHDARAHSQAALAARVPFVVSRRVAFPLKRSLISQWKYRQAARFLAVSRFVAGELERANIPGSKIDVVCDGVDKIIRAGDWSAGYPAVALDSRDPAKGRDIVRHSARLSNVPIKYSNDLTSDLAQASMFIYITRAEGFGSAALLAMAMGIPVIASNVGGLPEVLGDAGLLVVNDPVQIAAAMRRLREDYALAQTLIVQGKERVAERFSARLMVEGTIQAYRRALAL